MSTLHFWPDDIVENLPASPLTVLKEAGAELGQATRGTVEVEVTHNAGTSSPEETDYDFVLFSKAMNFRYSLFLASFDPLLLYPCVIHSRLLNQPLRAESETELRQNLMELLRSPKAVSAVKAMLAQSQ